MYISEAKSKYWPRVLVLVDSRCPCTFPIPIKVCSYDSSSTTMLTIRVYRGIFAFIYSSFSDGEIIAILRWRVRERRKRAERGHAAGNGAPQQSAHFSAPKHPLTTAPHVALSQRLPAWKFSFFARLALTNPCLPFLLRVVPYLHVPANHQFPHTFPAPLSLLIRQVSTDNFDSAMSTMDQATDPSCLQGAQLWYYY
jgi:hypothetical protein